MAIAPQIFGWLTLISFATGLGWALLLACDLIKRNRLPSWRTVFSVVCLFAVPVVAFCTAAVIAEAIQEHQGKPPPADGPMYCVLFALMGLAGIAGVGFAWFISW